MKRLGWVFVAVAAMGAEARLPRGTAEAEGVSSRKVLEFVKAADAQVDTLHSLMIVKNGRVVVEGWWAPEAAEKAHILNSVSKSFTSTAVGLAVAEGKLRLTDPVLSFFPGEAPAEVSENLKAMTVRDLLTMTCGHDVEPKMERGAPTVREFLAHPVVHKPGTHFLYNTPGSYVLSAIVTKVTGQTVLEYLKPRLFGPLGIAAPTWGTSREGHSLGGYGLYLKTEDLAKFGQLYLQKGEWEGRPLVPAEWVRAATSFQVTNAPAAGANPASDWHQGYGYQFWRCRHGVWRADGAAGQFVIVLEELNTVIAMTAETKNMQAVLDLVWTHLLPGLSQGRLKEDEEGGRLLREALAGLKAHPAAQ